MTQIKTYKFIQILLIMGLITFTISVFSEHAKNEYTDLINNNLLVAFGKVLLSIDANQDAQADQYGMLMSEAQQLLDATLDLKERKNFWSAIVSIFFMCTMICNVTALLLIERTWGIIECNSTRTPSNEATIDPRVKLTKLKNMFDAGLITKEEYDKKKADILVSI